MEVVLMLLGAFIAMVGVIFVVLLAVSKLIAKKKNVEIPKLNKGQRGKMTLFLIIDLLCLLLMITGVVFTALGLADNGPKRDVVGTCYRCDGNGYIMDGMIPITCPTCNGFGFNVTQTSDGGAIAVYGIVMLLIGLVGYFYFLFKIRKLRETANYTPPAEKPLSPYAVQVKLFDTSYDSGIACYVKITYTFTDADTGETLGRGSQHEIVTLNVDKPTRIKCHLGRGFKDAILNYTPRENAKYKVIPNSYTGIRFEAVEYF